jgi:aminotransferase
MKERSIYLHGFSKAWAMTGFRLGFACAPHALTEAMMKIHQYTMLCAPTLSQKAATAALDATSDDVEVMRQAYLKHRNYMYQSFLEMGLDCLPPQGAFYAFPNIESTGLTSHEFAMQLLEAQNVAVVPGSAFGPSGEGYIRCSFATGFDDIKEACTRMKAFMESLSS